MLLTKEVEVTLKNQTSTYYERIGYKIPKVEDKWHKGKFVTPRGTRLIVKTEDLTDGSNVYVDVSCENCDGIRSIKWHDYLKYKKDNGSTYCNACAQLLFNPEKIQKARLKNGKSFKQWCIENLDKEESKNILNRWDYDKNNCKPDKINFGTEGKYYFKCPEGIHESELKIISNFTSGEKGTMYCRKCNTFGQYLLNLYGDNALEMYWDYAKNDEIHLNPFDINRASNDTKVWIKCQNNKESHGSYFVGCDKFTSSNTRCPSCSESKGEQRISKYLNQYNLLNEKQKQFNNLIGIGGKNLSYDFYLPQYNLFMEYQGEFHDGIANDYVKANLEKQQEHDRRKKEYAQINNIRLLEIWYWDFDNIELILSKQLNILPI